MDRIRFLGILPTYFVIINILVAKLILIQTQSIGATNSMKRCPEGYILHTNELCYPNTNSIKRCPEGYILFKDELCYPKEEKPCLNETQLHPPPSTTIATPVRTTLGPPEEQKKINCPYGSIMMKNKCRKIICSLGEYYRGSCLYPVCPPGLVWRGNKCQEPGYLITVIEIENDFVNEVNENPIALSMSHKNEVVYHTSTTTTHKPITTPSVQLKTTIRPTYVSTSTTTNSPPFRADCCKVLTPRICKLYGEKWVCFNRRYQRCDKRICTSPLVYLKAPEIKHEPPVLIMPPNPQLADCETNDCRNNLHVDCSGCATLRSENCSPYCYQYICPNNTCSFMDLKEYCSYYPRQDGCSPTDGCLWNWC